MSQAPELPGSAPARVQGRFFEAEVEGCSGFEVFFQMISGFRDLGACVSQFGFGVGLGWGFFFCNGKTHFLKNGPSTS